MRGSLFVAFMASTVLLGLPGCGSRDGRDSKMDEIDRHIEAIDGLIKEMPEASPSEARNKALAAEVHLKSIWEATDFLKGSFKAYPPTNAQAKRYSQQIDRIGAAGDKVVAALRR